LFFVSPGEMCALVIGLPSSARTRLVNYSRVFDVIIIGVAIGLVSVLSFGIVHALAIVPIWTQLGRGSVQAVLAGVGLAWAFEHLARVRRWHRLVHGAAFGLVIFAALVPATLFANALRLAGVPAGDWPETLGAVAFALASGFLAGWLLTHERRASTAMAIATLGLTLASAGPIPVVNSARAAWLFVGFVPICAVAGLTLAAVRQFLERRTSSLEPRT
jgi:hypothetical protein